MHAFFASIAPWIWFYIAIAIFAALVILRVYLAQRSAKRELDASLARSFGSNSTAPPEVPADVLSLQFEDSIIQYERERATRRAAAVEAENDRRKLAGRRRTDSALRIEAKK